MECDNNNPAIRRFLWRFVGAMTLYVACLVVSIVAFVHYRPAGLTAYVLAVLPALPIIGMLVGFGLYVAEEKDEFQRAIFVQSMMWSTGATLSATTVWGFLENFVRVPHLQLILIFPLYCVFWGIAAPIVKLRYR